MIRLALRNVLRQRLRTALTLLAIALGVASLILARGFVEDVLVQLAESTIHSQIGHVQVFRAGYSEAGRANPFAYVIEAPQELKQAVSGAPGVRESMARLTFSGLLNNGRADLPIFGEGIEPVKERRLGSALTLVGGRWMEDRDKFGLMVGEGVASSLGLKIGDRVTLLANTREGALNTAELELTGVFRSFSKEFDAVAVRVPLTAAQELLAMSGATSLVILLDRTDQTDAAAAWVAGKLPGERFEVRTWTQLADFYAGTAAIYKRQFAVLIGIIFAMMLLGVINTVNMSVFERTAEFGTLRAMGDTPRDVFRLVVVENAWLGVLGATLGVGVGVAVALGVSAVGIPMPPPPNADVGYTATIRIVPLAIALAFGLGVVSTLLASLLPAWRVARVPIVDALRQSI